MGSERSRQEGGDVPTAAATSGNSAAASSSASVASLQQQNSAEGAVHHADTGLSSCAAPPPTDAVVTHVDALLRVDAEARTAVIHGREIVWAKAHLEALVPKVHFCV